MQVSFTAEELLSVSNAFKRIPVRPSPEDSLLRVVLTVEEDGSSLSFFRDTFHIMFKLHGHCDVAGSCMFDAKELKRLGSFFSGEKTLDLCFSEKRLTIKGDSGRTLVLTAMSCVPVYEEKKGKDLLDFSSGDVKFFAALRNDSFSGGQVYLSNGLVFALDNVHMVARKLDGVSRNDITFCYALPDDFERIMYAADLYSSVFSVSTSKTDRNSILVSNDKLIMSFPSNPVDPIHFPGFNQNFIKVNKKELLKLVKGLSLGKMAFYAELKTNNDQLTLSYFGDGLFQQQSLPLLNAHGQVDFSFDIRFLKKFLSLIPSSNVLIQQDRHILNLLSENKDVVCRFAAVRKKESPV